MLMSQPVRSQGSEGRSKPNSASSRSVRCDRSRRLRAESAGPSSLRRVAPSSARSPPGCPLPTPPGLPTPQPPGLPTPPGCAPCALGVAAAAPQHHPRSRCRSDFARCAQVPPATGSAPRRKNQSENVVAPSSILPANPGRTDLKPRPTHDAHISVSRPHRRAGDN